MFSFAKSLSCIWYLCASLNDVLLNNFFEADYFRLNFVASSAIFTMILQFLERWLRSRDFCCFGTASMMTDSTYTSKWLIHRRFLILNRNSRLRNVRVTWLPRFWLVFNWLPLTTVHRMLVWSRLHDLFTTVNSDTSIWPAWFFKVVNLFCLFWLVNWYKGVCLRLWWSWNVGSFGWMNRVCWFRSLG